MTFIIFHSDNKCSKTDDKTHKRDVMKHICVMNLEELRNKFCFFMEKKVFFLNFCSFTIKKEG